jgi:ribosomal protein L3 glutamine methyltransferase
MPDHTLPAELQSVRDFFRYAISRFNEGELVFAHGTTSALDEAAFMVLEGLHLPIDQLEPFLDARLVEAERHRLFSLIEERVTTRKPAAYLLQRAYVGGIPFYVDERVIVPRSFIGELMRSEIFADAEGALIEESAAVTRVLDLCTGSGCLAIMAAQMFSNATVDAVDLSPAALEVAQINVAHFGLGEQIELLKGDLFAPLEGRRYDLIITNPPYVGEAVMGALPPEFAHEPAMALDGGPDGFDIVRHILAEAGRHLNPGGGLICEIGEDREMLEAEFPHLPFLWLDTQESAGEVFWLTAEDLVRSTRNGSRKKAPRLRQ